MKKKVIAFMLLSLVTCNVLIGCGKSDDKTSASSEASSEASLEELNDVPDDETIGEFSEWENHGSEVDTTGEVMFSNVESLDVSAGDSKETLKAAEDDALVKISVGDLGTSDYVISNIKTLDSENIVDLSANLDKSIISYTGKSVDSISMKDSSYVNLSNAKGYTTISLSSKDGYLMDDSYITNIVFDFGDDETSVESMSLSCENNTMTIKSEYENAINAIVTFQQNGTAQTFMMTIGLQDGEFSVSGAKIYEAYQQALSE